VVMQGYGWYHWLYGGRDRAELPVTRLSRKAFRIWLLAGMIGTLIWGYFMASFTDAAAPYPDAFITAMSLIAQWLMARKKLESWYLWISVDLVGLGVYLYKDLYMTTGLYSVFLVLAFVGLLEWRKTVGPQPAAPQATVGAEA